MVELMAESEYVQRRQSLEFETQRIQLAAEVAKLKAWVKILEAANEDSDDSHVALSATLKSKTSHLDHIRQIEAKWQSQKETDLASTFR